MSEESSRKSAEAAVKACYSTWADTYHADYYAAQGAYPPVHQELVRNLLREHAARTLLDAGCGPASMLRSLTDLGISLYGFDLTPEMVQVARRVMSQHGVAADRLWEGSVADARAFQAPDGSVASFDAAICIGVLPHVPATLDQTVIANLRTAVRPGGLVVLEARNQLFGLFTLNRYSYDLFVSELIRADALGPELETGHTLEPVLEELKQRFRMDLPPVRGGKSGELGYDEVLSRTHNPLSLREQFASAGFDNVRLLFYHYHCLPPMFEHNDPKLFRKLSVGMENPHDWRGHFMASAFILAGTRK